MPRIKKQEEVRAEEIADKTGISAEKAQNRAEEEEKRLLVSPTGRFILLEVVGGYRVAKNRKWISPVLSAKDATKLMTDMNRKDPEQKSYNRHLVSGETPVAQWQEV